MVDDPRRLLLLPEWLRWVCVVSNVIPIPGTGAMVAGWRNPHSGLFRTGLVQMLLVVFGSFPLILPGLAGLIWAIFTAKRIHDDSTHPAYVKWTP